MGFFSWKTADTDESIMNCYGSDCRTVYLLQPDGDHIQEKAYPGYGVFGGVDAYEWLAEKNLGISERNLGITLTYGARYYQIGEKMYCCFNSIDSLRLLLPENDFIVFGSYEEKVNGKTFNDREPIKVKPEVKFPLKFSFNSNANYDDLPGSEDCPLQGHFAP